MDENLDETAIHEMEEVLGTKIYPGTEIMKDVGGHHFVKGSNDRSVLVPQPSDDPRKPALPPPGIVIPACTALVLSSNRRPALPGARRERKIPSRGIPISVAGVVRSSRKRIVPTYLPC